MCDDLPCDGDPAPARIRRASCRLFPGSRLFATRGQPRPQDSKMIAFRALSNRRLSSEAPGDPVERLRALETAGENGKRTPARVGAIRSDSAHPPPDSVTGTKFIGDNLQVAEHLLPQTQLGKHAITGDIAEAVALGLCPFPQRR